jgi:hypothetical protein
MNYNPNNNLNTPYIYNFEKNLWIRYYPNILDIKILNKYDLIDTTYKLYNKGVFLLEEHKTDAEKQIYMAFRHNKLNMSFKNFKSYCEYILNDCGIEIPVSKQYEYIQDNKIYVKNCSFSKTPYNLDNLKKNQYIKSNNIEIIEVGDKETP